ncbi:hypothetical protein D3C78_1860290 [compost metagenome]
MPGLGYGAVFGHADAVKQPHQFERALHAEAGEHVVLGKFGDRAGDIGGQRLEGLRQGLERFGRQRFDIVKGGREACPPIA